MKFQTRVVLVLAVVLLTLAPVQAEYYDFGGATITIIGHAHHPAHRFIEGDWPGQPVQGTAYGLHKEAERLFNCRIEFGFYVFANYREGLLSRLLAGDAENDVWLMTSGHFWPLLTQSVFYPMDEILPPEYFESLPGLARGMAAHMTHKGHTYSFGAAGAEGLTNIHVVAYNQDLFEELGLPDLQDIYEAGEWTWDKMGEIAAIATRTEGERNYPGMAGLGRDAVFYGFAYTNGRASYVEEIDGRMVFSGNSERFIEALHQARSWMEAGIACTTSNINQHVDRFNRGEHAMIFTDLGRIGVEDRDFRYGFVPYPRGPQSDDFLFTSMSFSGAFSLPVTSAHPEGLVQLMEFLYPLEDYNLMLQESIRNFAKDRRSAGILQDMHDAWSGYTAPLRHDSGMDLAVNTVRQVLTGARMAATAMNEIAPAQQAALDEIWN